MIYIRYSERSLSNHSGQIYYTGIILIYLNMACSNAGAPVRLTTPHISQAFECKRMCSARTIPKQAPCLNQETSSEVAVSFDWPPALALLCIKQFLMPKPLKCKKAKGLHLVFAGSLVIFPLSNRLANLDEIEFSAFTFTCFGYRFTSPLLGS